MTIGAVLPVKDTGDAKQRLAGFLSAAERQRLALAMAEDVLETLACVPALSDIIVVTRDQGATALAERHEGAGADGPAVTLVPSHDRRGTNCVLCSPPGALPFAFGHDSFKPHCEAARAQGIAPRILPLPGLGLDIDTPDDLRAFIARPAAGRTLDFLRESGIAERLLVTDAA